MALNDYNHLLSQAIHRHAQLVSRERKGDVMDYYREQYGRRATRRAAEDLHAMGVVRNRKGDMVGVESLMRRFQSRGGKSQGEGSETYAALGSRLPAMEKYPDTVKITMKGTQKMGDGSTRERRFTITLSAREAKAMAKNPDLRALLKKLNYPDHVIDLMEDGEYAMSVDSVE